MRNTDFTIKVAVLISSLSIGGKLGAQDSALNRSAMPIDVTAVPSKTLPGSPVVLEGTTGLVGDKSAVTIHITLPGATPAAPVIVRPASNGSYSGKFTETQTSGTYQVTVTAPDGKGKATTTFAVVSAGALTADVTSRMQSLLAGSDKVLAKVREGLDGLPISPPRDAAREKLLAIETQLKQAPSHVATFKKAMDQAFGAREKIPEPVPEWDEYLGELGVWDAKAKSAQQRLEEEAARSAPKAEACADLQQLADALAMISEIINIVQIPEDKSIGYWMDKVPAGLADRGLDATKATNTSKFAAVQTMKLAAAIAQGPKGWVTAVIGAVIDVGQYVTNETFDKYCVKFEGPLKGNFFGEALTRMGEKFWNYTIKLDGKVVLMYPKNVPSGRAVALQGVFEGAGSFVVRSNPAPINRLIPGVLLFHKVISPPGASYIAELGSGMGGFAPHSFRIPVKGILAGDSIVLTVQPATFDFSDIIKGRLIWVVMPLGGMWPEIIDAPIQLQKAQPIFERVIRRHPILKITKEGSFMVARGQFARDTTNADRTAHVTTELTLKACNPGCVPLPLNPQSKKLP